MTSLQHGFSLVELVIGIAIIGILAGIAAPSFSDWIQNTQIRTAAEAIQGGLQLSRSEAVRRNAAVQFNLRTGSSWSVCLKPSAGLCPDPDDATTIQSRTSAEGSTNSIVAADQSTIIFNGLGRVTNISSANICIGKSGVTASCPAGTERRMKIVVLNGGQIRMCDPLLTVSKPNDARAC